MISWHFPTRGTVLLRNGQRYLKRSKELTAIALGNHIRTSADHNGEVKADCPACREIQRRSNA